MNKFPKKTKKRLRPNRYEEAGLILIPETGRWSHPLGDARAALIMTGVIPFDVARDEAARVRARTNEMYHRLTQQKAK